jgi:hypothetical protein
MIYTSVSIFNPWYSFSVIQCLFFAYDLSTCGLIRIYLFRIYYPLLFEIDVIVADYHDACYKHEEFD